MSGPFTPDRIAAMVELYSSGVSATRIARMYGTDTSTVSRRLRSAGVSLRTQSASRIVFPCNDQAFEASTDD